MARNNPARGAPLGLASLRTWTPSHYIDRSKEPEAGDERRNHHHVEPDAGSQQHATARGTGVLRHGRGAGRSAANAALTPVYRFYHLDAGRHFYTASETEKAKVLTHVSALRLRRRRVLRVLDAGCGHRSGLPLLPPAQRQPRLYGVGVREGDDHRQLSGVRVRGHLVLRRTGNGNGAAVPLYRLYNTKLGTHFFTTKPAEANNAWRTWPWFAYEGAVFYVSADRRPRRQRRADGVARRVLGHAGKVGDVRHADGHARPTRDGTVVKVEYYRDGVKIGETTKAPHSYGYTLGSAGTYNFSAVATDNGGMTGASGNVTVTHRWHRRRRRLGQRLHRRSRSWPRRTRSPAGGTTADAPRRWTRTAPSRRSSSTTARRCWRPTPRRRYNYTLHARR